MIKEQMLHLPQGQISTRVGRDKHGYVGRAVRALEAKARTARPTTYVSRRTSKRDGVCNPVPNVSIAIASISFFKRFRRGKSSVRHGWNASFACPLVIHRVTSRQSLQAILIFSLIMTVCVFGVGDARSANKQRSAEAPVTTINLWAHSAANSAEYAVLKVSADRYNAGRHGYRVEVWPSTFRGYDEQINSAAATGSLPCLLEADGPFLYSLAWRGYLQPIDQLLPKSLLDDVLPSILAQGRYDGRLYSLGQFDSGLALWGNRRMLVKADVRIPTLKAPWTLAEFELALDKLSKLPGAVAAIEMGTYLHSGEFYPYAYSPILQGFGGDLIDRSNYLSAKGVLDGPQSVAAMTHFQQWFKKGWARADALLTEADGQRKVGLNRIDQLPVDNFVNGKMALSWFGHWQYPWYSRELGQDLLLLPLPDFGRGIKTAMGSWSLAISSTCNDPAGAASFLNYLMSKKEILRMTDANGAVPARRSALAKSKLYSERGPLSLYAQQLNAGMGVPRPNTPAYGTISRVFSNAAAAIIAGADVQAELSRAAALIDQDIAESRGYLND